MKSIFWLSDDQMALINPYLPCRAAGKRREDDQRIISGIIHVLQSGWRWQDCPSEYGPHTTVYNRYNRWSQKGIWQYMFAELTAALSGTPEEISLDSTHVKAYRCAGGGKGGPLFKRWTQHQDPRHTRPALSSFGVLSNARSHGGYHRRGDARGSFAASQISAGR